MKYYVTDLGTEIVDLSNECFIGFFHSKWIFTFEWNFEVPPIPDGFYKTTITHIPLNFSAVWCTLY